MKWISKLKLKWDYYINPQFIYQTGQHVTLRPMCASARHNKKVRDWFDRYSIVPAEIDFPRVYYILHTTKQIEEFANLFDSYLVK